MSQLIGQFQPSNLCLQNFICSNPLTVSAETLLLDAIALLHSSGQQSATDSNPSGCILVLEGAHGVGMFTPRDLVPLIASGCDLASMTVGEAIASSTTPSVLASQDIVAALALMKQHHMPALPVVDEQNNLLGLVTEQDLLWVWVNSNTEDINTQADTLRQHEQKFRTLAENSPAIIARFNRKLQHTYVNPAVEKVTGLPPETFIGKTNRELGMPENLLQLWNSPMQRVFDLGQEEMVEFGFDGPHGHRHYQVRFVPEFGDDGIVASVLGITTDITQIKQAEESLRQLNEELEHRVEQRTQTLMHFQAALQEQTRILRAILNSIGDGVVVADQDGRILIYNPAAIRIMGCGVLEPPSNWSAQNDISSSNQTTSSYLLEQLPLARAIRGDVADNVEVYIRNRDRPEGAFLDVTIRPFKDDEGHILGGVNTFRDITDKKCLERTLQESERRLQAIIDNSPLSIYVKDLQGRYILVNKLCASKKGFPQEQIIGKTAYDVETEELADRWRVQDQELINTNKPIQYEEVVTRRGQQRTYITHKFLLFDTDNIPYAICGISTDITERKQLEEQIWASLRKKDLVIQEIHHRIKNNLQIVSSLLTLQSRLMKDPDVIKLFQDCQNRILSIALIHEQLYRSSDFTNINFSEYIYNLVNHIVMSYHAQSQQVKLTFDLANVSLNLDTVLPCGLLINELVCNSLKYAFSNHQGNLFITLNAANNGQLTLVVEDDGRGLPDDFDIQRTRSLGLQLVYDLASQLKGVLTLDRVRGTRFQLIFSELKSQLRL